jgi:hypothetical protein
MNKDDKNRHFALLIIDISKHGAKEMGHVKMTGPGFVNDVECFIKSSNCGNIVSQYKQWWLWISVALVPVCS